MRPPQNLWLGSRRKPLQKPFAHDRVRPIQCMRVGARARIVGTRIYTPRIPLRDRRHICRYKRGKTRGHIDIITRARISAKSPRPSPHGSARLRPVFSHSVARALSAFFMPGGPGDPRLFRCRYELLALASSDSAYIAPSAVSSCLKYVNTSASRAICPTFTASALRLSSE